MLNEYAAVRNNDKAYELGKIIYMDLLRAYKEIDFTSRVTKPFQKKYFLELRPNLNVPIIVTYPKKNVKYSWFKYKGYIEINVNRPWKQNHFFEVYFHEITHALDFYIFNIIKNKQRGHDFGVDFIKNNYIRQKINGLDTMNKILYRLWDTSERNAYQLNALLGETYCNEYIEGLKSDIDYLSTLSPKEIIWKKLMNSKEITKPARASVSVNSFKNFFIKKSYYLLELFTKKLFKNVKYFSTHQIEDLSLPNETQQTDNGDYPQSKTMEIICYQSNSDVVELIQTRSESLLEKIKDYGSSRFKRVIVSNDQRLVDFLVSKGYTKVFRVYKYWNISNANWLNDIEQKYHFTQIYPISNEERQERIKQSDEQSKRWVEGKKEIILFLRNEQNKQAFINEYFNALSNKLGYKEDNNGYGKNFIKPFKKKICGITVVVKNSRHKPYIDFDKTTNTAFVVFDANYDLGQYTIDDLEWYINVGKYENVEEYGHYKDYALEGVEKEVDYLLRLHDYSFND